MLRVYKQGSKNKLRDINIAIAYHNTGRTLVDVGNEFHITPERVRQAHHGLVRHISRCMELSHIYFFESRSNHCEEMARMLAIYKDLLERNEMKIEITINNKDNQPSVILSSCNDDNLIQIHVCNENNGAEISIEELKASIRKLSAK